MEFFQERVGSIIEFPKRTGGPPEGSPMCKSILKMVLYFCSSTIVSYGQGYFSQPTFSGAFHSLAVLG